MAKLTGKPTKRQKEEPRATRITRRQAPGRTIESREHQIARLAYDLVEEKIRKKTASSQELIYFLKMGSTKDRIEKMKLEHETNLLKAKTDALESQKKIEELYANAIRSMRLYQGVEDYDDRD